MDNIGRSSLLTASDHSKQVYLLVLSAFLIELLSLEAPYLEVHQVGKTADGDECTANILEHEEGHPHSSLVEVPPLVDPPNEYQVENQHYLCQENLELDTPLDIADQVLKLLKVGQYSDKVHQVVSL